MNRTFVCRLAILVVIASGARSVAESPEGAEIREVIFKRHRIHNDERKKPFWVNDGMIYSNRYRIAHRPNRFVVSAGHILSYTGLVEVERDYELQGILTEDLQDELILTFGTGETANVDEEFKHFRLLPTGSFVWGGRDLRQIR